MEHGVCLEQRIEEGDQVWIKRVVPLFPPPPRGVFRWLGRPDTASEGAVVFIQDITDEVQKERELKTKSAMIQEVHHRVKNNLQTVASLLRMEARRKRPGGIQETLHQTINRILSIAVVHEFLSRGDGTEIDIRDICGRIVSERVGSTSGRRKAIEVAIEGERFSLPAQQATSCALAMNELVQNAIEHGFPGRDGGSIRITMRETDASMVIEISDDGVGLPAGFDPAVSPSLGLRIVRTLVQDDLRGRLEIFNGRGTTAQISFPKDLCRPSA
jgi:two-component sensor histidine kinase